jgi:hypothetical protein
MLKVIEEKEMPPWHANQEFHGVFDNERTLSEKEIATFTEWVKTGAARGRPEDAPASIVWGESDWTIGEPDLIIAFEEPFYVVDEVEDLYHTITVPIPAGLTEDRWVKAVEFKPGSEVVHHIIGYAAADSDSEGFSEGRRGMIGGIAPGNDPDTLPEGYGLRFPASGTFIFAMHYHKERGPGTAMPDVSSVALKFYDKGDEVKPVHIESIGNRTGWEIPPFHENWEVGSARRFDRDVLLLSMMPHMHLRGKSCNYVAFYPDGTSEALLEIDKYDFNWQESYNYKALKLLPAGTRLENTMIFDNSKDNSQIGGFNPARPVGFGGPTTDEMDLGWITWAYAEDGETQE